MLVPDRQRSLALHSQPEVSKLLLSLRGLELVSGEWSLVTAAHNIMKAWRFRLALA